MSVMIELLNYLGVTAGWNFVFKPILEDLATDSAKDFAKDFCKDALKSVLGTRDIWAKATTKALKEFLEQFEQELIGAGATDESVILYTSSLRHFTKDARTRLLIGQA